MHRTQTICLIILATIAVGFSLAYLKTVLLPFIIAVFIVIGCRPVLEFVERKLRLHRFLAFLVTFSVGGCLLAAFALLTWVSIVDLAANSAAYEQRLNKIAVWLVDYLPDAISPDTPNSDPEVPAVTKRVDAIVPSPVIELDANAIENETVLRLDDSVVTEDGSVEGNVSNEAFADAVVVTRDPSAALQKLVAESSRFVQGYIIGVASALPNLVSYTALVLIFVFFLLLENTSLRPSGVSGNSTMPMGLLAEIEEQVRKYLVMKTALSLLTGFAFGFVLWLFGVPLAIVFGFMAFLLNYIPNIGPLLACLLPVPFLMLSADISPVAAITCFVLISTIQFISGNVIEQRMMGKSFDVSPIVLLLGLILFGLIWGIVGMFLATPIVSILKIVLQQSESGKPIAELMAGRFDRVNGIV
ncbi:AI-2E family transporter [Novipirellula sp. SH528]|uniref:AI-2E family transporter n=1 Tax=Novipirellula sp. SH528 TaxID=3454466 RepID=UPI003FA12260